MILRINRIWKRLNSSGQSFVQPTESDSPEFARVFFLISLVVIAYLRLRDQISTEHQETMELLLAPTLVAVLVAWLWQNSRSTFRADESKVAPRFASMWELGSALLISVFITSKQPWSAIPRLASYGYLWDGFGQKVALLTILIAVAYLFMGKLQPIDLRLLRNRVSCNALNILFGSIALVVYVPSFIQTSHGIINIGDATYYVIEEIVGPLVGKYPGINFISSYTSLLGIPLIVLKPFGFGSSLTMSIVLIYANILFLLVPLLLIRIVRSFWNRVPLGVLSLGVLAVIQVSGRWGSASAMTESWSRIPGRTLLPIVLFYLYMKAQYLVANSKRTLLFFLIGVFGAVVVLNNAEFGGPAILALLTMIWIGHKSERKVLIGATIAGGFTATVVYLLILIFAIDGASLDYRFAWPHGKGFGFVANRLPIISSTNLALGLLFVGSFLGLQELIRPKQDMESPNLRRNAALASTFFGLWGLLSFGFFAYVSTGAYSLLFIATIPTTAGILTLCSSRLHPFSGNQVGNLMTLVIKSAPFVLLVGLSFASIIQAPAPVDELRRVVGEATYVGWSRSSPMRAKADVWSSDQIDFVYPADLLKVVNALEINDNVGYFGYMGNSIEIASGIPNLTGGPGFESLGSEAMAELSCSPIYRSEKKYVISMMTTSLCPGLLKYREVNGWTVYVKSGN